MKVKQLIHELNAMPQNAEVRITVFHTEGDATTDDFSVDVGAGMDSVTLYGHTDALEQKLDAKRKP